MSSPSAALAVDIALVPGPLPKTSLQMTIAGVDISFDFFHELVESASSRNGMDFWAVTAQSTRLGSSPVTLSHATPAGAKPVGPRPAAVLARIASDLSLALAMPKATGAALDWLFTEGYATWLSDAPALHGALSAALASAKILLASSGITLAAFITHVEALPLVLAASPCMGPTPPLFTSATSRQD